MKQAAQVNGLIISLDDPNYSEVFDNKSKAGARLNLLREELQSVRNELSNQERKERVELEQRLQSAEKQVAESKKPVPLGATAESLTKRGFLFLEDAEWKKAAECFDNALDIDPEYAPAYIGMLCADLKVKNEEELPNQKADFSNNRFFKQTLRFASNDHKAKLEGYITIVHNNITMLADKARIQDAFNSACRVMDYAQNPYDYYKAITAFDGIDTSYQDLSGRIIEKIAECKKRKQEMEKALDEAIAPLRELFDQKAKADKQERLNEQKKLEEAKVKEANDEKKVAVEIKRAKLQQQYDDSSKKWQDRRDKLKTQYDATYKNWEDETNRLVTQSEKWKTHGLCACCGGKMGLFGSCKACKRKKGELPVLPSPPSRPHYPSAPKAPLMPEFIPSTLDESKYILKDTRVVTLLGMDWVILDVQDNNVLLITQFILEKLPYHKSGGSITWESCSLRNYLNTDFFYRLGAMQYAIAETLNYNPKNPWYDTSGGKGTKDRVFLLSLRDVVQYYGDSGDLQKKKKYKLELFQGIPVPNGYKLDSNGDLLHDQYDNARKALSQIAGDESYMRTLGWWLRSSGLTSGMAAYVDYHGCVNVLGENVSTDVENYVYGGVRPALWIDLSKNNVGSAVVDRRPGKTLSARMTSDLDFAW